MKKYKWALKDGNKGELSFSPNFDNIISKYKDKAVIESIFLMNCGITSVMPYIMRYCFEESVDLRERAFLKNLSFKDSNNIEELCAESHFDEFRVKSDFQRPLKSDKGPVRSVNGNLIIYSLPHSPNGKISFDSKDVSELVEGVIKVLDCEGVRLAQIECMQIVQHYHKCLDEGILK